jgi:hypothetical protein
VRVMQDQMPEVAHSMASGVSNPGELLGTVERVPLQDDKDLSQVTRVSKDFTTF